jgi:kinesin family protein 18/19
MLIYLQVRRNVADVTYHLAQYHNIIQDLKEEIKRLHRQLEKQATSHHSIASVHDSECNHSG